MSAENCIFCKIVRGEIPSRKVYEDDEILAFHDIQPMSPVHILAIPKEHIESMATLDDRHAGVVGRIMVLANRLAIEQGSPDGFRVVCNSGRIGRQDVYHLHIHVLGGPNPLPGMIARPD
ncbi:MAG: histidine triad nucleotide-binding protein [Betaproteobacteria bacterium]